MENERHKNNNVHLLLQVVKAKPLEVLSPFTCLTTS